jgi:hypothetical protein
MLFAGAVVGVEDMAKADNIQPASVFTVPWSDRFESTGSIGPDRTPKSYSAGFKVARVEHVS